MKDRKLVKVDNHRMGLSTECLVHNNRRIGRKKNPETFIRKDCNLIADMEATTVTLSVQVNNSDAVITLRMNDLVDLMMAANTCYKESANKDPFKS